jgi:hypothetical protein
LVMVIIHIADSVAAGVVACRLISSNSVSKLPMLSVRAVYVLSSLQLVAKIKGLPQTSMSTWRTGTIAADHGLPRFGRCGGDGFLSVQLATMDLRSRLAAR